MRFLFSVIADRPNLATSDEAAAIDDFNDRIEAAGQRVYAAGLEPPASARVIDHRAAEPIVSNAPPVVTEEFMIGFWIIEAADWDEALRLAQEGSAACRRKVEVRRIL